MRNTFFVFLASSLLLACSSSSSSGGDGPATAPVTGTIEGKPFAGKIAFGFLNDTLSSNPTGKNGETIYVFDDATLNCNTFGGPPDGTMSVAVQFDEGADGASGSGKGIFSVQTAGKSADNPAATATYTIEKLATVASDPQSDKDGTSKGKIKLALSGADGDSASGEIEYTLCF